MFMLGRRRSQEKGSNERNTTSCLRISLDLLFLLHGIVLGFWRSNKGDKKMKEKDVPSLFAKRMQDMGKAEYLVKSILEDEYFSCHFLSKHNEYWDSKHEIENDKLDEARRKFSYLQDRLWNVVNILEFPGED